MWVVEEDYTTRKDIWVHQHRNLFQHFYFFILIQPFITSLYLYLAVTWLYSVGSFHFKITEVSTILDMCLTGKKKEKKLRYQYIKTMENGPKKFWQAILIFTIRKYRFWVNVDYTMDTF